MSLEYMSLFLKVKWMKRSGVKISSSISIILSCSKDPHLRWPPTPPKAKERRTNFQIVFRWTSMTLKKKPPPLYSFSEKEMSSSLFTWWYYDEVMTSWRGNLLTLKSAANNHVQILFLSLLCVSFSRNSCRRQWTKRTYMYNIWRFELLPVRFLTCSKRISVKTMQGCNCYDLAMGHPQKMYGLESS